MSINFKEDEGFGPCPLFLIFEERRVQMPRNSAKMDYLQWLVDMMNVVEDRNYGMLLRELFRIEFYEVNKYDRDRGMDGLVLRTTWADEVGYSGSLDFGPPTLLETLIGIAQRIEFRIFAGPWMDEWDYKKIFWHLIDNLGFLKYDGVLTSDDYDEICDVSEAFLSKNVTCDKFRNIFGFCDKKINVKKDNLWDQMMVYYRQKWPGRVYF